MPTPRQQARELLRPLFSRPVSPEQRAVTDAVERRIAELEDRIEAADGVARRLMIEAARDQSSVVAVGKALDQVRVALRGVSVPDDLADEVRAAIERLDARKDEDVDEWAKRLGADFAAAGEAEYQKD